MSSLSFPSKTFLLGEYAVLGNGDIDAILLAHSPFFRASYGQANTLFHPESPAGIWLKKHPSKKGIEFHDPHSGKGGFGGSGAEFLAAWFAERTSSNEKRLALAWHAWDAAKAFPGSGADIFTQAYGVNRQNSFFLTVNLAKRTCEEIASQNRGGMLSLFHTGKKLATHEQLSPPPLPMQKLRAIAAETVDAFRNGDFSLIAQGLQAYGDSLEALGLLAEHSKWALADLKRIKNIAAAKGCGAMGADVLLVAHSGADLDLWAQENLLAHVGSFPV